MKWLLTNFAVGDGYVQEQRNMVETCLIHNPGTAVILGINTAQAVGWRAVVQQKARWCLEVWQAQCHDYDAMLWLDADARVRKPLTPPPGPVAAAVHPDRGYPYSGTVWFSMRPSDHEIVAATLRHWVNEIRPGDEGDEQGLERAIQITQCLTVLTTDHTSVCSRRKHGYQGQLEHDSAIVHWNHSRKVNAGIQDWPPSEEHRRSATT